MIIRQSLTVQQFLQNNLSSKLSFMVQTLSIFTFSNYEFLGKIKRKSYICIPSSFRGKKMQPFHPISKSSVHTKFCREYMYNQVKTDFCNKRRIKQFCDKRFKILFKATPIHYSGQLSVAARKSTYPIRNVQLSEAERNNISPLQ